MDIMQCRLTDEEITVALEGVSFTPGGWQYRLYRGVADAATEQALRCILLWLKEFEEKHQLDTLSNKYSLIIRTLHGHGLQMAAEELEALLGVKP